MNSPIGFTLKAILALKALDNLAIGQSCVGKQLQQKIEESFITFH